MLTDVKRSGRRRFPMLQLRAPAIADIPLLDEGRAAALQAVDAQAVVRNQTRPAMCWRRFVLSATHTEKGRSHGAGVHDSCALRRSRRP
jgi:hypothetical protein